MGQQLNPSDNRRSTALLGSGSSFHSDSRAEDALHLHEVDLLRLENLQLKCFVSRLHAELMEMKVAAGHAEWTVPDSELAIRNLTEKLRMSAEALDEANMVIRQTAEKAQLLAEALSQSQELIRRKDMLNREIDHRVKNSLQLAVSLLRIQAKRQKNAPMVAALRLASTRVEAIARIHKLLQAGGNAQSLDFGQYLRELGASLCDVMGIDGQHRTLVIEVEPMTLPADTAQALALAINELVTNAFQHAFASDQPGTVWIQSAVDASEGTGSVTVADDGKGLPEAFQFDSAEPENGSGLGLQLVAMVSTQIGARLHISRKGGTRISLVLHNVTKADE
jgi:two-component system, sensor histidine kinase PdtaS